MSVRGAILEEEQNFSVILNRSLSILKPLFLLIIIFAVIRHIPSAAHFPITLGAFLDIGQGQLLIRSILLNLASFFTYFNALVTAFTFCTPFVLIYYDVKVLYAFKLIFKFIRINLLKYLIFVGIGILIIFLPSLLHNFLKIYIHPFKLEFIIIEIFVVGLRILLAVIFYIAMFDFLIGTNFKHSLNNGIT